MLNSINQENEKFSNPEKTLNGSDRAKVSLKNLDTLWFNTGTVCNLNCQNCYIESSPNNDRLQFIDLNEVKRYLNEILEKGLATKEIGLTGGEPFLHPKIITLLESILQKGFKLLVLTNAYRIFNRHKQELTKLNLAFPNQLNIRVSLDHHSKKFHEQERGENTFEPTLKNIVWLEENTINWSIAGRSLTTETLNEAQTGYSNTLKQFGLKSLQENQLIIFPEMDLKKDVPEITTQCWTILNKNPDDMMCSNSRMIIQRKGQQKATVAACTLLAYDNYFELGDSLTHAKKTVFLKHKFCAQFCVLGGASCS